MGNYNPIFLFFPILAEHIEDHRKNLHILSSSIENPEQQIIMYSNQDPVLASSSELVEKIPSNYTKHHLHHSSRTGSPISHSQLSTSATPPMSVANEIILPHGTIIDRGMITQ